MDSRSRRQPPPQWPSTSLRLEAEDDGTILAITVAIDPSDPVGAASTEQRERFDHLDEYLDMLGDW